MSTAEKYANVLDALTVLKDTDLSSVDKSVVEEQINNVYKEIITNGILTCRTTSILYTFADNSVLTFNREIIL